MTKAFISLIVAAAVPWTSNALAQTAEPQPKIVVDAPLPEPLSRGVALIRYRTENLQILPVFGPQALDVSPRIGHLHVAVDGASWVWADTGGGPIIVAGLPEGADDDEAKVRVESDRWNNEQVHGSNVWRVVMQEGPPSLAWRPSSLDHVFGDARRRDPKPELEQFAVNAWRAPKRILDAHSPDQQVQLRLDLGSPSHRARLPMPVATKAGPVPTHDGLDDRENLQEQRRAAGRLPDLAKYATRVQYIAPRMPLTPSSGDTTYHVPSVQVTAQEQDMNARPNIDPVTTHSDSNVLHWLTNDTRDERFIDNIFAELCLRLQRAGIPVKRASLHILIYHPQWLGARIMWADGMREAELARVDYDVRERSEYIDSPANEIHDGATEVRENLERDPSLGRKHAVYDEMRAKGLTDYVAWPLYHTLGKRHIVTFATDRPGGFDDAHIAGLLKLLPALALVSEIRIKNRLARTLLETYVGSHASELILAGATRRGSGTTVRAAIMICDLRDFTRISDNWPRDDVIDLLNGYFDAMSEPIARHGGEILKFIGDGLLAIFPLSQPSACANLLHAVAEARQAMIVLNERNGETGRAPLNYGIGVHVGDVMYGNIGSRTRLDFTVIGPAVNMASRLETLTKQLGRTVLLSRAFADFVESDFDLERVGEYPVRGFNDPIELFAYHG